MAEKEFTFVAGSGAFGDGLHPTTEGAVLAIQQLLALNPAKVLDVGCGAGLLSMIVLEIWPCTVVACDILAESVEITQQNLVKNGFATQRFKLMRSDGYKHKQIIENAPYDLVLCNILAEPIILMADDAAKNMKSGGYIILSGILQWQVAQVLEIYLAAGFTLKETLVVKNWRTLILIRS